MKLISVNYENISDEWWDAARDEYVAIAGSPEAIVGLMEGRTDAVIVDEDLAEEILIWASSLPGWYGDPLIFSDVGADNLVNWGLSE